MNKWFFIRWLIVSALLGSTMVSLKIVSKQVQQMDNYYDSLMLEMHDAIIDKYEKDAFLVTLTTYNAISQQCDSSPNITASGLKVRQNSKYVALSRDLLADFPYGSLIKLENAGEYNGIYVVADCMSVSQFRTIDVLLPAKRKHTKLKNVVLKYATKE